MIIISPNNDFRNAYRIKNIQQQQQVMKCPLHFLSYEDYEGQNIASQSNAYKKEKQHSFQYKSCVVEPILRHSHSICLPDELKQIQYSEKTIVSDFYTPNHSVNGCCSIRTMF